MEGAAVIDPVLEIYTSLASDDDYQEAKYQAINNCQDESFEEAQDGYYSGTIYYDGETDPATITVDLERILEESLIYNEETLSLTGLIEINLSWLNEDDSTQIGTQIISASLTNASFTNLLLTIECDEDSTDMELYLDGTLYDIEDFLDYM